MKKIIFLLLSVFLFESCAILREFFYVAQESDEPISFVTKDIGLIAGAGVSNENGAESYEPTIGGTIGVETTLLQFNENTSIRTGVNFSLQGANYSESFSDGYYYAGYVLKSAQSDGTEFSGKVNLIYLNLPLMFQYMGDIGIYGEIGIQPGLRLSSKDKGEGYSENFNDQTKTMKVSGLAGAGYKINNRITVGARAIAGLTNNIAESNLDPYLMSNDQIKSKDLMIMGIVRINLNAE